MVAPAIIAMAAFQAAKMVVNTVQAVKGISEADKAVANARKQSEELNQLLNLRILSRMDEADRLIGAQNVAAAQAGLSYSSGLVAARNNALIQVNRENVADQLQTRQRTDELILQAKQGKQAAKDRATFGLFGEGMESAGELTRISDQARREGAAKKEQGLVIPTKPLATSYLEGE